LFEFRTLLIETASLTVGNPPVDQYIVSVAGVGVVGGWASRRRESCRRIPENFSLATVIRVPFQRNWCSLSTPKVSCRCLSLSEDALIIKVNRDLPEFDLPTWVYLVDCHSKGVPLDKLSAVSKISTNGRKCCPAYINLIVSSAANSVATYSHKPVTPRCSSPSTSSVFGFDDDFSDVCCRSKSWTHPCG